MHDRALMHAVEFLRMHLIGVDHRRAEERQPLAGAPHGRLGGAAARRGDVEHLAAPRRRRAGDADPSVSAMNVLAASRAASGTSPAATRARCAPILSTTGSDTCR